MKYTTLMMALTGVVLLTGCDKGPSDEEVMRQEVYETNVQNAPELSDEAQVMIQESRGVVIREETDENEQVREVRNSFSPGAETVEYLSSLTKEELLEMDAAVHLEIFINGVIRDEYTVAAHTLYGAERIQSYKEAFREGLLSNVPVEEGEEPMTYVDRIGQNTEIRDTNVARHHVDVIINQLNRIFVQVNQQSDFGSRVTVSGQVYPVRLREKLSEVNDAAFEFIGVHGERYRSRMSEEELDALNSYYRDTFNEALLQSPISEEDFWSAEIGGFQKLEDGTWEPAQMPQFAWNLIRLVYGIR